MQQATRHLWTIFHSFAHLSKEATATLLSRGRVPTIQASVRTVSKASLPSALCECMRSPTAFDKATHGQEGLPISAYCKHGFFFERARLSV